MAWRSTRMISTQVLVKGDVFRYAQFDKDAKTTRTLLGLRATDKGSSLKNKPYDVEAVAFLPKSLETSEKGKGKLSKGLAYLAVHKSRFRAPDSPVDWYTGIWSARSRRRTF